MVDEVTVRAAAATAWSIFRARRPGIDPSDNRRCLLERHLQTRGLQQGIDAEVQAALAQMSESALAAPYPVPGTPASEFKDS